MPTTHLLETDSLLVTVADAGAELVSVIDRASGRERIWSADPAVWNRHAPILFPFVGKVTDGKYRTGGREYAMKTQHGFARDLDFACAEETASLVEHRLCSSDWTRERYPFDFCLSVRHRVDSARPRVLRVEWTVENPGAGRMLFSVGGHPGFLMPEGVRKEDCALVFPGHETLCYYPADAAGFALSGQRKTLALSEGAAKYQPDVPDTWIFEDQSIDAVGIRTPDGRPLVTLRCPGFPFLAVWANPRGSFICLEPWFGRTDEAGFAGELAEKPGVVSLEPGESWRRGYEIEFHA